MNKPCERCNDRKWVPLEGTVAAAIIEAVQGKSLAACPECTPPVNKQAPPLERRYPPK